MYGVMTSSALGRMMAQRTALNLIDEHTRESLMVRAERRWSSARVISALADVMVMKECRNTFAPTTAGVRRERLRKWLAKTGAKTLYIEPGSPWENGYCESFNSKLRDEFLNGNLLLDERTARAGRSWRVHYNTSGRTPRWLSIADTRAWLINSMGMEKWNRYALPLPHTPDGGYLNSK